MAFKETCNHLTLLAGKMAVIIWGRLR